MRIRTPRLSNWVTDMTGPFIASLIRFTEKNGLCLPAYGFNVSPDGVVYLHQVRNLYSPVQERPMSSKVREVVPCPEGHADCSEYRTCARRQIGTLGPGIDSHADAGDCQQHHKRDRDSNDAAYHLRF